MPRCVAAFDDHQLIDPGAVAAEGGSFLVFGGLVAGDGLIQRGEFDNDAAFEIFRAFEDLKSAAAGQHLAAEFGDDCRHPVGIFLVINGVDDMRPRQPVGNHVCSPCMNRCRQTNHISVL